MKLIKEPKKSLGQNFLTDKNIINKIVKTANINKDSVVLEIGAGYGSLTKSINELNPKKIFAVEKDKKLSNFLKEKFINETNIKIINDDILNLTESNMFEPNIIVFGNLPYNISTQILASLILLKKWPPWYHTLVLMFQKEVADRIIAQTNTKEFGRLAILCNWRLEVKKHFDISKNCFFPKPKINSTLLSFKPKKNNQYYLKNPKTLEKITRIFFSNRRKMINKKFKLLFNKNEYIAEKLNINLSQRPEELSCENFYNIAAEYEKLIN